MSGGLDYSSAYSRFAVRPASSNAVNFKKVEDTRAFGSVARIYDAWLRSGSDRSAYVVYLLYSSGAHYYDFTSGRYAVRPASSNAVNFKKAADIPCFWVCRSFV